MTAKEYLQQYRESIARADEVSAHLNELKAEAEQLRNHEGQSVRLDAAVAKYVDACDDAGAYLDMLDRQRKKILAVIDSVPDFRLRTLLRKRYVLGDTWEQVAVEMNYSYMHICRLHGAALQAVSGILGQT